MVLSSFPVWTPSSLPRITGMPSQMYLYSQVSCVCHYSPSEAFSKDAISSGMVPSPPKEHMTCLHFFPHLLIIQKVRVKAIQLVQTLCAWKYGLPCCHDVRLVMPLRFRCRAYSLTPELGDTWKLLYIFSDPYSSYNLCFIYLIL